MTADLVKSPGRRPSKGRAQSEDAYGNHHTAAVISDDEDGLPGTDEDYIPIKKNLMTMTFAEAVTRYVSSNNDDSSNDIKSDFKDVPVIPKSQFSTFLLDTTVKTIVHTRSNFKTGLFMGTDARPEHIILEMRGELMSKQAVSPNSDRFVFAHASADILLDARRFGNEARFARYSCQSNAEVRFMFISDDPEDLIRIGVYATRPIMAGEEITIPYMGLVMDSGVALDCACADEHTCLLNPHRRDTSVRPSPAPESRKQSRSLPPGVSPSPAPSDNQSEQPDSSMFESELFTKPLNLLTREERKMRDELLRFARMEKQNMVGGGAAGKPRKPKPGHSRRVSGYDSAADQSSASESQRRTSHLTHITVDSPPMSQNPSPKTSAPASPMKSSKAPSKPSFFSKKAWLKMYIEQVPPAERESGSQSDAVATDLKPHHSQSSETSHAEAESVQEDGKTANLADLSTDTFESVHQENESASSTPAETVIDNGDSTAVAAISTEYAPVIGVKRAAPNDDDEPSASAATSMGDLSTMDAQSGQQVSTEGVSEPVTPATEGAPPAAPTTKRISLKDYKKKRKLLQEQEQLQVAPTSDNKSDDAAAHSSPALSVDPGVASHVTSSLTTPVEVKLGEVDVAGTTHPPEVSPVAIGTEESDQPEKTDLTLPESRPDSDSPATMTTTVTVPNPDVEMEVPTEQQRQQSTASDSAST